MQRVHVLLDSKGKTLSHAYVEVKDQKIAGSILRGEAISSDHQKKERGSVLGRGRRARGVTITRSSQEELMADVSLLILRCQLQFLSNFSYFPGGEVLSIVSSLRLLACREIASSVRWRAASSPKTKLPDYFT